jgi:hypothetical protein
MREKCLKMRMDIQMGIQMDIQKQTKKTLNFARIY